MMPGLGESLIHALQPPVFQMFPRILPSICTFVPTRGALFDSTSEETLHLASILTRTSGVNPDWPETL